MADPKGVLVVPWPGPTDTNKSSYRLIVDEATADGNSVVTLNPTTMELLSLFRGDAIIVHGKKGRDTMLICSSSDSDVDEGRIQMNQVARNNLRVKVGDLVDVHHCADIKYCKRVHILPFDDSIEGWSGNIFEVYLKPYFLEAFRPVHTGDTFLARGGTRTVEFKVMATDPSEFCIIGRDTIIRTDGEPVKREKEDSNSADVGNDDIGRNRKRISRINTLETKVKILETEVKELQASNTHFKNEITTIRCLIESMQAKKEKSEDPED